MTLLLLTAVTAEGQIRKTVKGSREVVTEAREAGSFSEIRVSSGIDVNLSQGEKESIEVIADDNLCEYILTEVRKGILHIYTNVGIRNASSLKVDVTMVEVNAITTTSAGDVTGLTPVNSEKLTLSTSSAGDINLEVFANEIIARTSSAGDIKLSGEAGFLKASVSSAGDLKAYDLIVKEAEIATTSAGSARVNVTERLKATASSAGSILYKGNPRQLESKSTSSGSIRGY